MATIQDGKISFPNMLGTKRRRMRSGGGVSTATNNTPKAGGGSGSGSGGSALLDNNLDDEKLAETSRCKGANTIPIFLKKTYKMIETCDQKIASWTPDGEMFVVKNPDLFASKIIPQYFDHNKFSSFARQLNFYGFRKMQAKPIRNADFDVDSAKHVTFYNEKFKRGRCDLLKEIQRSTRGGGSQANQEQMRQIENLKKQVAVLEDKLKETNDNMEERIRRLELEMLGRMEQMMLAMQQTQMQSSGSGSNGNNNNNNNNNNNSSNNGISSSMRKPNNNEMAPTQQRGPDHPSWDPLPLDRNRSVSSFTIDTGINSNNKTDVGGPTLPPHPKQKNLPINGLPKALALPPSRLNSLRGISNISMSRGVSTGITRNMSESSTASALLNNWENGFFTMLMTGESEAQQASGQTPQQQRQQQQQQQQQNDYSAGQHSINDAALTAAAVQMQNLAMSQQQQIPAQKQQGDGMNPQFNNSGNTTAI